MSVSIVSNASISSIEYCCQICWFLISSSVINDYIPFVDYFPESVNCTFSSTQYSNGIGDLYDISPELSIGCYDDQGYVSQYTGQEYIGTYGEYVEYSDTAITHVTSYGCDTVDEINNLYDTITSINYVDFITGSIDDIIVISYTNKLRVNMIYFLFLTN